MGGLNSNYIQHLEPECRIMECTCCLAHGYVQVRLVFRSVMSHVWETECVFICEIMWNAPTEHIQNGGFAQGDDTETNSTGLGQ